jgi:anthranilate phosphoribosyltransferase
VTVKAAIGKLVTGADLTREEARAAMANLVAGEATTAQIAGFAVALCMKGETAEEIAGLAEAMREASVRVEPKTEVFDLVGTGGDSLGTFNISALSALIVASAGGKVAKHGNRSITSQSGSADFLEAAGIAIDLNAQGVAQAVDECGFAFMFAPMYHPAMRHAGPARAELGVRTIFNILGPLANPARAKRQLTGVAVPGLGEKLAAVLELLGSEHAMIVHGAEGMDEISLSGPTEVHETKAGVRSSYTLVPEDFGIASAPTSQILGGTVATNLEIAHAILAGETGPKRDIVLLNAGAGLYVAGLAATIAEGIGKAADEIDSGRAAAKMKQAAEVSQRIKAETAAPA